MGCNINTFTGETTASECSNAACLAACKARYYACTAQPPNGQANGSCKQSTTTTTTYPPMTGGPYSCQCNCCNTGSYSCTPTFVGYSNAFSCQIGACSIACANQYPYVCVNNYLGQTQGTCLGLTSPTPPVPTGGVRCGCVCQGTGGYQYYEMIATSGCSSCSIACKSVLSQCSNHQNTYCI
ncbi:unnamed protein product [Adineta ricciae]|uniref:Uncharacterized protein n=1 Tax=Adineta ricciae TaxID=249248 RepID=A0A814BQP3_ADIRI|nr:unnamed protein product [Adineta ricciae]CAF0976749.1 unnamed protein product [Adineta ricciae]